MVNINLTPKKIKKEKRKKRDSYNPFGDFSGEGSIFTEWRKIRVYKSEYIGK